MVNVLRLRTSACASLIAWASLLGTAAPVAAECTQLNPWPSFRIAARSAQTILVGEVVQGYDFDSTDSAVTFQFRVDETFRGRSEPLIEFRHAVQSTPPPAICPGDSVLRVKVGDVIALAFDSRAAGAATPVLAVGYIRGDPDTFLMPDIEHLTLDEVRRLAAMPETDTVDIRPLPDQRVPVIPWVVAAALGVYLSLRRTRGSQVDSKAFRRTEESGPTRIAG